MAVMPTNTELASGIVAGYEDFAELIEGLDADAWHSPTRCTDWEVRDVASHVAGLAADAVAGVPGSRTPDEHAASLRDHSPSDLAAQLRASLDIFRSFVGALDDAAWNGPSGVPDMTLARGVLGLWFDTYVHADDVRAALDFPEDRGSGLAASVIALAHFLTSSGWGPATLALEGMDEVDIGAGGPKVTGDPYQFVLVGSGRADPATLGLDPTVNIYRET
jgi:uncharacterized protein (TIGR03083 family)